MTPIELISTFRKKIHRSTLLALLLLITVMLTPLFFDISRTSLVDLDYLLAIWPIPLLGYVYARRVRLLEMLKNKPEDVVTEFDKYLERKFLWLNKSRVVIFVIMAILLAVTLYKVFFSKSPGEIGNIVIIWAAAITFFAIDAWILMKDRMMLQDIKHAIRENYSEIS